MKALKITMISLLGILLVNCGGSGGKSTGGKLVRGNEARGLTISNGENAEIIDDLNPLGMVRGRITTDDVFQGQTNADFEQKVRLLLRPQLDANLIGEISGDENQFETGISFWGRGLVYKNKDGQNGVDPLSFWEAEERRGANLFNVSTAELRVSIFHILDNLTVETPIHFNYGDNTSGELIDAYAFEDQLQLVFADSYGRLALSGLLTIDGSVSYYEGQVWFRNLVDERGESVSEDEQLLGKFKIETCGFFECK